MNQRLWALPTLIAFLAGWSGICLAQQNTPNQTEPIYKCDTDGIQLEGTLVQRTFYGPPGFGETPAKDARDKVLALKLSRPITVVPTEGAEPKKSTSLNTIRHVHDVQLFVPHANLAEAGMMLGRMAVVVGTLHEAVAPGEHTDVTMVVKTLTAK